jgi:hypothetical protein
MAAVVMAVDMAEVGVMAEATASMAHPLLYALVRAAFGTPTASASAGGDLGPIAVSSDGSETRIRRAGQSGAPFLFADGFAT